MLKNIYDTLYINADKRGFGGWYLPRDIALMMMIGDGDHGAARRWFFC